MAAVHAIEIADGQHAAVFGALGNATENLHGAESGKSADYSVAWVGSWKWEAGSGARALARDPRDSDPKRKWADTGPLPTSYCPFPI
ncbi:hypothetical protein ZRA01_11050 [Zoogloea ramigera]|uniref:Uncharacterized protein n=1 Tax=Zoogloea ramigera TaxID=350 RepID=A0A4Y4CSI7_ZOORA|nr:hypothetical protein ZRA01_11050 [Zoogloea ramigera]